MKCACCGLDVDVDPTSVEYIDHRVADARMLLAAYEAAARSHAQRPTDSNWRTLDEKRTALVKFIEAALRG